MLDGLKVLFLTTVLPGRKRMGSEVASQSIIDALRALGADVTVAGYVRHDDAYACAANEVCVGRSYIETKGAGTYPLRWFGSALLRGLPYSVAKYRGAAFVEAVRRLLAEQDSDVVVIDHLQLSWLLPVVGRGRKLVGLMHNVEHRMYEALARDAGDRLRGWVYGREARLLRNLEADFANAVDHVWVLTQSDAQAFAALRPGARVDEIPLAADVAPVDAAAGRKQFDVGLIGSWTWRANEEGLRWFVDAVQSHLPPSVEIRIAGNGAKWLEGRFPNVRVMGFVDDAQEFLRQARVVAIPTLNGGGIQIKTLDAIASGSRIVATSIALRGIDDRPATVTLADGPADFAARIASALAATNGDAAAREAIEWSRARQRRFERVIVEQMQALAGHRPV